jgi:hypothetical protein
MRRMSSACRSVPILSRITHLSAQGGHAHAALLGYVLEPLAGHQSNREARLRRRQAEQLDQTAAEHVRPAVEIGDEDQGGRHLVFRGKRRLRAQRGDQHGERTTAGWPREADRAAALIAAPTCCSDYLGDARGERYRLFGLAGLKPAALQEQSVIARRHLLGRAIEQEHAAGAVRDLNAERERSRAASSAWLRRRRLPTWEMQPRRTLEVRHKAFERGHRAWLEGTLAKIPQDGHNRRQPRRLENPAARDVGHAVWD